MKSHFTALKERHVPQAAFDAQSNTGCMDKTRVRILKEIEAWIKDPDAQPICWIAGMAGTGKTTIAKTVCERVSADPEIMLGGSFFCSRTAGAAQRDIRCVVPTLAQLLSRQSAAFSCTLAAEIGRDPDLQHKHVMVQVKLLLYTPLLALKDSTKPILLVIDALDECGSETVDLDEESHQSVSELLEALVNSSSSSTKLPVKFLLTSRPEIYIRETTVSDKEVSQILRLHAINKEEVDADIHWYITESLNTRLSNKPSIRAMFSESVVENPVQLCDGLFIVASTTIKHTFGAGAALAEVRYKKLLNDSRDGLHARVTGPLDRMYEVILEDAARQDDRAALLQLLAALLSARMALSVAALAGLLALEPCDVRERLSPLHAVVELPEDDNVPGLRTIHASFGDYLFGRASSHIRIPRSLGHETLAHACLHVMAMQLHFNISQSRSSYEPNPTNKPCWIASSLEYACLEWIYHVAAYRPYNGNTTSSAPVFDAKVNEIFRPKFLFWLEVISVLHKVGLASGLLLMAISVVSCFLRRYTFTHYTTG